jgi:hypothetical protein
VSFPQPYDDRKRATVTLSNNHLAIIVVQARYQIAGAVVFCRKSLQDLIGTLRRIETRRPSDKDLLADFVSIVGHVT